MIKINFKFEIWKNYAKKIGEMLLNDNYLISQVFKKDNVAFQKFKKEYEDNFIKYKTKERFSIPIIGKISSGKSTFLNSILQGNYLSSGSDIETKFICIIRHNKKCKTPIFCNCEVKEEEIDYYYTNKNLKYYYYKKIDVLKGNIVDNIKNINNDLFNYEKITPKEQRNINKYFYILEINIPLFSENEELGDYFEFMDIPGLNEESNESTDFYFEKIIPKIVNKCIFSIYIFYKYESEDASKIYNLYFQQLNKIYNTNSIYILNKIDEIDEKERDIKFNAFKHFLTNKNDMNKDYYNINSEKNVFLQLS